MNKRFSTLLAAFAAIASVASAQISDKYVYLVSSSSPIDTLTWTKAAGDSLAFKTARTGTKAAMDSALWKPKFVERLQSGDSVFQFVNKATQKNLSFAIKKNAAGKYGTVIAPGVDKFVYHGGAAAAIYATCGTDSIVTLSSTNKGELTVQAGTISGVGSPLTVSAIAPGTVTMTAADLKGRISSMKFDFNGKDGGLFTATELIPTDAPNVSGKVRFQVVGSEKSTKGTKPNQYITVDTVSYSGTVSAAKFQLDTLCVNTAQYKGIYNAALQNFIVEMDLSNDSISLTTDTVVIFDNAGKYTIATHGGASPVLPYIVGYKDLNGTKVLTIDSVQVVAPLITLAKGTPVKLAGGTGVYALQVKAKGGNSAAANNNKYLTYAGTTYTASASEYIPSTQFYVKENEDGTYSAQGRDNGFTITQATAVNGSTTGLSVPNALFTDEALYAVDAANGIYTYGNMNDTLAFTKMDVDMANKNIGYKYYTKQEMSYGAIAFNLSSQAADDIYLSTVTDTIVKGAKTTFADALQLRLTAINDAAGINDTVSYGAQALGDTLSRVAYSLELPYDANGRTLYYDRLTGAVKLSKDPANTVKRFFFIESPAGESYKIVDAKGFTNAASTDSLVTMNISTLDVAYAAPTAGKETYFKIEGAEAPVYAKVTSGHYNVVDGSEMLTASAGVAKLLRVGDELKAASTAADYSLFVDSAFVNRGENNTKYGYYIYKGAKADNDTIVGSALYAKGSFVAGTATGDSALFVPVRVVKDSIWYADTKADKPIAVTNAANKSVVMFKVVDGGYVIEAMNGGKNLAVVNGTVIFSSTVAPQVFTLNGVDAPTANEGVTVSEVSVIAGQGSVRIAGAEGKKVVISNLLGQLIANTVITSDDVTIAATQGMVVVAVEGETAVKAIVK